MKKSVTLVITKNKKAPKHVGVCVSIVLTF